MSGWQSEPFQVTVKAGETKAFCMCGKSANGPFCDGSHKGTNQTPKVMTFDSEQTLYICGCQRSQKRPFCDGSHTKL